jgi:hypothetical protein
MHRFKNWQDVCNNIWTGICIAQWTARVMHGKTNINVVTLANGICEKSLARSMPSPNCTKDILAYTWTNIWRDRWTFSITQHMYVSQVHWSSFRKFPTPQALSEILRCRSSEVATFWDYEIMWFPNHGSLAFRYYEIHWFWNYEIGRFWKLSTSPQKHSSMIVRWSYMHCPIHFGDRQAALRHWNLTGLNASI